MANSRATQEVVVEMPASPHRSSSLGVENSSCEARLVRLVIWLSLQKPTFALLVMTQTFARAFLRFVFQTHPELARRVERRRRTGEDNSATTPSTIQANAASSDDELDDPNSDNPSPI